MSIYIAIALGGSLGAVSRYWVSITTHRWLGNKFSYGTLAVNVIGSLLTGFFTVLLVQFFNVSDEIRFGLLVGFLGSFTTFSTFAMDTLYWINQGQILKSISYILLSVLFCLVGVWIGLTIANQII